MLDALPEPRQVTDAEMADLAENLEANPSLLGPLATVFDRRRETDWLALTDEIAGGVTSGMHIDASSALGGWLGESADIPGLSEVREAIRTATPTELSAARKAVVRLLELGRAGAAMRRTAQFGTKADRRVRETEGRGVELTFSVSDRIARQVLLDRMVLALTVGACIALERRGLLQSGSSVDADVIVRAADLIDVYRSEVPEVGRLLNPRRLHDLVMDELEAERGDSVAKGRVTVFFEQVRQAAELHRPPPTPTGAPGRNFRSGGRLGTTREFRPIGGGSGCERRH
jgi:hypothetical protein